MFPSEDEKPHGKEGGWSLEAEADDSKKDTRTSVL